MPVYKFKGQSETSSRAQGIGEALCEIRDASDDGLLHMEAVVEAAKEDDRLHGEFEWDDVLAAHQHRLEQARTMSRSIEIMPEKGEPQVCIRAWINLRSDVEGYRATPAVLSSSDLRASLISQVRRDFESFRRRYETLAALASAFEAFEEALDNADK